MKRLFFIAVTVLFLFSSCSVQTEVDPDLFLARFAVAYPEFTVDTEGMFYENNKCVAYINNSAGRRFVSEITVDEAGRVQKISLACAEADKAEEFYHFSECVSKIYAPQEDFAIAAQKLFGGKSYAYYETQGYYYCCSQTETGLFFSVENKRLAPEKEERLTLKETSSH